MFHKDRQPDATIQNIAAGDYDHLIEDWLMKLAAYCATGRTAVVVYLPEMNGNWTVYATDNWSPTDFIKAWQWFVIKARSMGLDKTMVKWCWAPNDPFNSGHGELVEWWPGATMVDQVGGSLYNWGGIFNDADWVLPADILDPYVRLVRTFTDKSIIATQIASGHNDSRTPAWLDHLVYYTDRYQNIEGFIWYNELMFELGWGCDWNEQTSTLNSDRPDHWFTKEEPVPTQHPDAIQVVPCEGRREGKNWVGGSGKPKLLLHTIEGADEDMGWPRDWTRWCATPHLAMHPWKYGRGETDGLYQLVGFDKAAYSLRDNDGEDDQFIWQIELAGKAANVPTYGDDWYRGVAKICQWFIENMEVADRFADFDNPTRMNSVEWNAFSGIMGHVHFGAGVDTHTDPGHLDVARLRSFMEEEQMDYGRVMAYVRQGDVGFAVEEAQVKIIMAVEGQSYVGGSNKTFVETYGPPSLTFKEWDQALTDYFSGWTGRNSYGYGPTEKLMVEDAISNL
jgi:hypothetical protein